MARVAVQALVLVALAWSVGSAGAVSRLLPRLYTAPILFDSGGLYRMNGDGSGLRALPGDRSAEARLSPDGKLIAFRCANGAGICVTDPHGRAVRQLTPTYADGGAFGQAWSPDSRRILFSRYGAAQGLYTVDLDSGIRRLTSTADENAAWSPDGRLIAFTRDQQIHVLNADGTQDRAVGRGLLPRWSPNARWLSFVVPSYGLFKVRPIGGRPVLLVEDFSVDSYNWSPDGRMIAFAAEGNVTACCGATRIGLVTSTGRGPWWLTQARGDTNSVVIYQDSPTWAPSGKRLAFVRVSVDYAQSKSDPDVTTEIWSMDANGRHKHRLTSRQHQFQQQDHQNLTWAPSSTNEHHDRSFGND